MPKNMKFATFANLHQNCENEKHLFFTLTCLFQQEKNSKRVNFCNKCLITPSMKLRRCLNYSGRTKFLWCFLKKLRHQENISSSAGCDKYQLCAQHYLREGSSCHLRPPQCVCSKAFNCFCQKIFNTICKICSTVFAGGKPWGR